MPAIDSNLYFFTWVACTLPRNLFMVPLKPISVLLSSLGALLGYGFVLSCCDNSCYSPCLGESCFSNIPPCKRKDVCPRIKPKTPSGSPHQYTCQHTEHPYIPAFRSWPNTTMPWSPFPAIFYKAISSSSWMKTPDKPCWTI